MKRTEIARIFADMEHYGGQSVTVCRLGHAPSAT